MRTFWLVLTISKTCLRVKTWISRLVLQLSFTLGFRSGQGLVGMVTVRVRCWVDHYTYESLHKDISTGCVCVCFCTGDKWVISQLLVYWHALFQSFMDIVGRCVYNQNPHSSASNQLSASLSLPFLSPVPADAAFLLIYLKFNLECKI